MDETLTQFDRAFEAALGGFPLLIRGDHSLIDIGA